MTTIINLSVLQIRIFPSDAIPFSLLCSAYGTEHLKKFMSLRTAGLDSASGELVFEDGAYRENESSRLLVVPTLTMNNRRLTLSVMGASEDAHLAYVAAREFLSLLGPGLPEPIFFSEETVCVARLDFDWRSLVNPELVSSIVALAENQPNAAQISLDSVRFTIDYDANKSLTEEGVILSKKQIFIEPRSGVPLSERVYYTGSPCSSDDHIALLKELEVRIAGREVALEELSSRVTKRRAKASAPH